MRLRTGDMLDAAWEHGIRYVDVARSYGLAESFLGDWLRRHPERREQLMIGSKWGYEYVADWRFDVREHERKEHSARLLDTQWEESTAALGTRPDIYLIHSVTPESPALRDPLLLSRLQYLAGRGTRVGFSTSGPHQGDVVDAALALPGSPFTVVQATWNLLEQSAGPALQRAHDAGYTVVIKEALANGRLTDAAAESRVASRAHERGLSLDGFALSSALGLRFADHVLSGAVSAAQLASNLEAAPLSEPTTDLAIDPEVYWRTRSTLPWG